MIRAARYQRLPRDLAVLLRRAKRREFRAAGWAHSDAAALAAIYMTQTFGEPK